ncbi:hypothetical protein FVEG_11732 [Fusarium verticillioides 7600]|uniref:Uncharacterized protein n=1 Tax=Gibberella moniliformis (strain M3125 / FGSC 7600) TaxID=334819 RepID=W7MP60_GIBM7|nr:hypothetical protein FVEG_11732 [Fusarium verticillioides 7600]EWG53263.1 hypothetical protein FVEG_11732 [Fusarium verticillioides 7600]
MAPPVTKGTKKAIKEELDSVKKIIKDTEKEIEQLKEQIDEAGWQKLGFRVIVTGKYPPDERVAAQRNHEEACNKENDLISDRKRAEGRLATQQKNQRKLEEQYQSAV